MTRTYDWNGETREIRMDAIGDQDLAGYINDMAESPQKSSEDRRMLCASGDRILCLMKERDQARNAILAYGKGASFDWDVLGRIDDLENEVKTLSEQRAELAGVLGRLSGHHDAMCSVNEGGNCKMGNEARDLVAKYTEKSDGGH